MRFYPNLCKNRCANANNPDCIAFLSVSCLILLCPIHMHCIMAKWKRVTRLQCHDNNFLANNFKNTFENILNISYNDILQTILIRSQNITFLHLSEKIFSFDQILTIKLKSYGQKSLNIIRIFFIYITLNEIQLNICCYLSNQNNLQLTRNSRKMSKY